VNGYSEAVHDVIQQHAVLRCRTDSEVDAPMATLQLADDRCHLDGLGSRSNHHEHVPTFGPWSHDGSPFRPVLRSCSSCIVRRAPTNSDSQLYFVTTARWPRAPITALMSEASWSSTRIRVTSAELLPHGITRPHPTSSMIRRVGAMSVVRTGMPA